MLWKTARPREERRPPSILDTVVSEEVSEGVAYEWSREQRQRGKKNLGKKVFAVTSLWPMIATQRENPRESPLGPLTLTKCTHICVSLLSSTSLSVKLRTMGSGALSPESL